MPGKARIFSNSPDGSTWLKPDSVSQRYARMCARKPLDWDMHIHQLRHYSATELISAGVDVTTVGGRLGHGGGGSTTLRFYSAWVSEADQRAAGTLSARLPELPVTVDPVEVLRPTAQLAEDKQYQRIAAYLRGAIVCGVLKPGDKLPTFADLAGRYSVAFNTAQRAQVFSYARAESVPGWCGFEIMVGENAMDFSPDEVAELIDELMRRALR